MNEFSAGMNDNSIIEKIKESGVNLQELLNIYFTSIDSGNPDEENKGRQIIIAFLRKEPQSCLEVLSFIKSHQQNPKKVRSFFPLLAETGHQSAQEALLSIAGGFEFNDVSKMRAVIALSTVKYISDESADRLMILERTSPTMDRDVKNTMLLCIGAVAKNAAFPTVKEKAINYIHEKLNTVSGVNDERAALALDAAGNTGSEVFLPNIQQFIFQSKNEYIVKTAIKSLANIPLEKTENTFIDMLKSKDNIVKITALQTLKENNQTTDSINSLLLNELKKETDNDKRELIISNLLKEKKNWNTLKAIAENSKENWKIRKIIFSNLPIIPDKNK